jgi:mono/diheme cytochrome c family protein
MQSMLRAVLAALCLAAPAAAQDAAQRAPGRYLVDATAACDNCHTPMGPPGPVPGPHRAGACLRTMPAQP